VLVRRFVICTLLAAGCQAEANGQSVVAGADPSNSTIHEPQSAQGEDGALQDDRGAAQPRSLPPTERSIIHYEIRVELDPSEHFLRASTSIHFPTDRRGAIELYLNDGFEVASADVNGISAGFSWGSPDETLPYVDAARALIVAPVGETAARSVSIAYHGKISKPLAEVNMVEPDLTELAIYAAWYPVLATGEHFTYRLQVTAPREYSLLSRGERISATDSGGDRRTEVWEAAVPDRDVQLVAARGLLTKASRVDDVVVEVYYSKLPDDVAQRALDQVTESIGFLQGLYGPTAVKNQRLVFSPRAGWGYSRIGLIAQSEQRHLARIADGAGSDDGPHGNAHEIAHLWWRVADPRSRHDWINEALAEYAATIDSWRRCGDACGLAWMQRFAQDLHKAPPARGIAATGSDDEARHVNWYERGAMLFLCLEQQIGRDAVTQVLRELLARGERRPVETADVVELVSAAAPEFPIVEWIEDAQYDLVDRCMRAHGGSPGSDAPTLRHSDAGGRFDRITGRRE
jgi:hypothetical protein